MSKNKIWTCLTRVISPSQITIFINSDKARNNLFNARIKQYFNFKVNGYKNQDKIKNRNYENDEYITGDWFMQTLKECNQCYMCKKSFSLDIIDSVVKSDITADRIDNKLAHTKNNCKLACVKCNITAK